MKRIITISTIVLLAALAAGMAQAQQAVRSITLPNVPVELKPGEGKEKVETRCIMCHSTDYIHGQPPLTRAQWAATVNKMIGTFGAPVPPDDAEKIIAYLSTVYGMGK